MRINLSLGVALAVGATLVAACAKTGPSGVLDNGQTGSIGAAECTQDADCSFVATSGAKPGRFELLAASCEHLNMALVCACQVRNVVPATAEMQEHSWEFQLYPGNRASDPQGCSEWSIAPGCLYCASEFPGCSIDEATSCEGICDDLVTRANEDRAQVLDVSPRLARCNELHCEVVSKINGKCYAGAPQSVDAPELDCDWPDDELAEHAHDPRTSRCEPTPSIACATALDCPRGLGCNGATCGPCSDTCTQPSEPTGGDSGPSVDGGFPNHARCVGDTANECASGEVCVEVTFPPICVPDAQVTCQVSSDCGSATECLVSGFDSVGRGTSDTRTSCQ